MFCPFLWIAKPEVDIGLSSEHDCLQEKCAWWDETRQACLVQSIANSLVGIMQDLDDILKILPAGQSFVK